MTRMFFTRKASFGRLGHGDIMIQIIANSGRNVRCFLKRKTSTAGGLSFAGALCYDKNSNEKRGFQ